MRERSGDRDSGSTATGTGSDQGAGRRTLTERLHRKADSGATTATTNGDGPAPTPDQAFAHATSGDSTDVPYRGQMEHAFGADFGNVRAHVGGDSAQSGLHHIQALAATDGQTIAFGEQNPSVETVAHELAHVVQARGATSGVHAKSTVSSPSDSAEIEADRAASLVASGKQVEISAAPGAGISRIPNPPGATQAPAQGAAPPAPNTSGPAAPVAQDLDSQVQLDRLFVSAQVRPNVELFTSGDLDIRTTEGGEVSAELTSTALTFRFSPALELDVAFPGDNMLLSSVSLDLRSGQVHVHSSIASPPLGLTDQSEAVHQGIETELNAAMARSGLHLVGANPLARDRSIAALQQMLNQFTAGRAAGSPRPGQQGQAQQGQAQQGQAQQAPNAATQALHSPTVGATFRTRTAITRQFPTGAVSIPAGTSITASVRMSGEVANIASANSAQAGAAAAQIQGIGFESNGVQLLQGQDQIAILRSVELQRGGTARVLNVQLVRAGQEAQGAETAFRLLGTILGATDADPTHSSVDAYVRTTIEEAAGRAFSEMVLENRGAVPGIDLATILGVSPAPPAPAH